VSVAVSNRMGHLILSCLSRARCDRFSDVFGQCSQRHLALRIQNLSSRSTAQRVDYRLVKVALASVLVLPGLLSLFGRVKGEQRIYLAILPLEIEFKGLLIRRG